MLTFAFISVSSNIAFALTVVITVADVFHLAVPITFRAPGAVAVAAVIVALTTIIFARGVVAAAATTW